VLPAATLPERPSVAVLLPVLDEEAHIGACLASIAAQDYPGPLEVLLLDGGSTDGTLGAIGRARVPGLRVLSNPGQIQAAGLQVGLAATAAEVIVRMDAHAVYAPDYVRACVAALRNGAGRGVHGVGGVLRAQGTTPFGRAVATAMALPGAIGPGAFHHADQPVEADTAYLGAYTREALDAVGGWDETLAVGEDAELNWRLRRHGGCILVDPAIRSTYRPRETARGLRRQFFRYGKAKGILARRHGALPSWRPLAPAALVAGLTLGIAARRWRAVVCLGAAYGGFVTCVVAKTDDRVRVARATAVMHLAHGTGFWVGLLSRSARAGAGARR